MGIFSNGVIITMQNFYSSTILNDIRFRMDGLIEGTMHGATFKTGNLESGIRNPEYGMVLNMGIRNQETFCHTIIYRC